MGAILAGGFPECVEPVLQMWVVTVIQWRGWRFFVWPLAETGGPLLTSLHAFGEVFIRLKAGWAFGVGRGMIPVTVDAVGDAFMGFLVFRVDGERGAAYVAVAVCVFARTHFSLVADFQAVQA